MRIVVCVKTVPGSVLEMRLDRTTQRLVRTGRFTLSSLDRHAVEAAARLKSANSGAEAIAIAMAPSAGTPALREALSVGIDRAVLIADSRLEGSDMLATSRVLAAAIARESPDIVLWGPQSDDGGGSMLWAAVAERLALPAVSQAVELELTDGVVVARRQTEHGYETLRSPLPVLVSVGTAVNQPRLASVKGKVAARGKPIQLVNLETLGLAPDAVGVTGSRTTVLATGKPPERPPAIVFRDVDEPTEQIFAYLSAKGLV